MSDYWNLFNGKYHSGWNGSISGLLTNYFRSMDRVRDDSHGGTRAFLDSLPISGSIRNYRYSLQKAEDRYNNTGLDEAYGSPYASDIPFVNSAVGAVTNPARMARSLMSMYGAEVALNTEEFRRVRPASKQIGGRYLIGNNTDIDMEDY